MAKITYLLGAGASCGCLPIYSSFQQRFERFVTFIGSFKDYTNVSDTNKNRFAKLYDLINKLTEEFKFHNTPDTVAKKYFHSKNTNQLIELKDIIILFFLFEQTSDSILYNSEQKIIKEPTDKRYESFIAALLKPIPQKIEILENIHVLTWNYDLQFEISFAKYLDKLVFDIQDFLQSFPKIKLSDTKYIKGNFSIIHLNGIAYARPEKITGVHNTEDSIGGSHHSDLSMGLYLLNVYDGFRNPKTNQEIGGNKLLSFAWENINSDYSLKQNEMLDKALSIAEETEYLIIIGYSFPIFNRAIDLSILNKMKRLKNVYLQTPTANNISNLVYQILEGKLDKNKIEDIGYHNQFFIPDWAIKTRKIYNSILPK
jgi:hypothetical protein